MSNKHYLSNTQAEEKKMVDSNANNKTSSTVVPQKPTGKEHFDNVKELIAKQKSKRKAEPQKPIPKHKVEVASKVVPTVRTKKKKNTANAVDVAIKNTPLIPLQKNSLVVLNKINAKENEAQEFAIEQIDKVRKIRSRIKKLHEKFRDVQYIILQDLYKVYIEIQSSPYAKELLDGFRGDLKNRGVRIQENTTDEGVLIRYIWGDVQITPANVFKYGCTLSEGRRNEIAIDNFSEWLKKITITQAVEDHKRLGDLAVNELTRMQRARIIVLRLMEALEVITKAKITMPYQQAQGYVHRDSNLVMMLGTATRRMDRENFYADINVTMYIPVSFELDIYIVNKFAKYIVNNLEKYEREISELEEKVWAADLYSFLIASEEESNKVSAVWWANRQQTSKK